MFNRVRPIALWSIKTTNSVYVQHFIFSPFSPSDSQIHSPWLGECSFSYSKIFCRRFFVMKCPHSHKLSHCYRFYFVNNSQRYSHTFFRMTLFFTWLFSQESFAVEIAKDCQNYYWKNARKLPYSNVYTFIASAVVAHAETRCWETVAKNVKEKSPGSRSF